MKNVFKLIQSEICIQLTAIYASSASNCLKRSKGKAEAGCRCVEGMQLREVNPCARGVVLCPSLCQDLHAKLMSSGSRSATAELNDAHGVPPGSCNYNYYNLSVAVRLLQPSHAHLCMHSTRLSVALQVGGHLKSCLKRSDPQT